MNVFGAKGIEPQSTLGYFVPKYLLSSRLSSLWQYFVHFRNVQDTAKERNGTHLSSYIL